MTVIEVSIGRFTVSTVVPLIADMVAEIVDVPCPVLLARPPALMVATLVAVEAQVTALVIFAMTPPLKVPVAVNCWVAPRNIEGFAGVTVIELRPFTLPVPERLTTLGLPKAL